MADYSALKEAVIEGNASQARALTQAAIDSGAAAQEVLDSALIPAMDTVGEKFVAREFYIPEMLIAARAMQAGLAILKPLLLAAESKSRGKVVLGTVKGDLHDIGKNLVGMMLQGGGFDVVDLGTDVKPARFVEAVAAREARPRDDERAAYHHDDRDEGDRGRPERGGAARLGEGGHRGGSCDPALCRRDRGGLLRPRCHRGRVQGQGVRSGVSRESRVGSRESD